MSHARRKRKHRNERRKGRNYAKRAERRKRLPAGQEKAPPAEVAEEEAPTEEGALLDHA